MALAIKYRPTTLKELAGNSALKKSLASKLNKDISDMPHCFLFSGISGGGKTTLAGIIKEFLECDVNEYYVYNSANFRGIDTVRELERTCMYGPMNGDVRIWVFNECHKWTGDAQNAMLDLMEEKMPPHAFFILTTTEPNKLILPLRKRCVEYTVEPLDKKEMESFIYDIIENEEADVPDEIVSKIVDCSNGSSRNALQLLEKVIDLDPKAMKKVSIEMEEEEAVVKDLIDCLLKKEPWSKTAAVIKRISAEPETIRYAILGYCNAILLNGKENKQAALIMDCFSSNTYDTGKAGITLMAYRVYYA